MDALHSRIGFEVELLAPPGLSRRTLAERVAADVGGVVARTFHTDSEPSLVPGTGHFWHLSPGFGVVASDGTPVASFVDDITIVRDLTAAGRATRPDVDDGWFRILSDDLRLLRLVERTESAGAPFGSVLDATAALFGTVVERIGGVRRVSDRAGATVAMATAVPAGRDRPCEVVTVPVETAHHAALERLLGPARDLGFSVPAEAAVHLHLDAARFRDTATLANLVRLFTLWRPALWAALGTNPAATKVSALPEGLLALCERGDPWPDFQRRAAGLGLTKYADVNLTALLTDEPLRDTVEVRILPGSIDTGAITARAALVEGLLDRCSEPGPLPAPSDDQDQAALRALVR